MEKMSYQQYYNTSNVVYKTAVYIRLSREDGDKEESDSVGNQRKMLLAYLEKKKNMSLYKVYIDDGYTGTNFDRPGVQEMFKDIEDGKVNCVIVKDLSRFGRDYIDTGHYLERIFPQNGVRFISINDDIDSMKRAYDMMLPIKNIFNEQYARDISKKVQSSVKTKQKAGEFIGAFACYGYKKSKENKNKLVVDEYAAGVVRRIYALYIKGYGKQRIARLFNEEGILCPSEYKRLNGENYVNPHKIENSSYWSYSTINIILHKEMYIGNMVQGTKHQQMRSKQKQVDKDQWIVVEGTHEAIIDLKTWNKAQKLLNTRTRELDLETNQNIFAGFLKCADCGHALVKNTWKKKDGGRSQTFYCGTYKRNGNQFCSPHSISFQVLEKIVLDDLGKIITSISDLEGFISSKEFTSKKALQFTKIELERAQSELEKIKKIKHTLYDDYKEELISKEEYLLYREDYQKKEDLYTKQLKTYEQKKEENVVNDILDNPWLKRLLELQTITTLDREIIVEMIHQITVYENRKIKIIYNFSNELEDLFTRIYSLEKK